MKVKDWKAKYIEKKDENAEKAIYMGYRRRDANGNTHREHKNLNNNTGNSEIVEHIWSDEPTEKQKEQMEKKYKANKHIHTVLNKSSDENAGKEIDLYKDSDKILDYFKKNGVDNETANKYLSSARLAKSGNHISKEELGFIVANHNSNKKDENAGKEIANNKKVSTRIGDESIVHLWEKKPTNEEIAKQEENYKEHNKPQFHYVKDNYEENLRKRKNADYTAIDNWKDENADKNIETSQENGYSEEQAKAAPNDTLVKDDKDADIKTDDASPKNLEEIKYGNLDAKISPDSDFKLSPEMEKWLIANGWKKPEEK